MDVIYINLDRATDRRNATETNFAACNTRGWRLHRQAATDKRGIDPNRYGNKISTGLMGLALSHRACVRRAAELAGHVMIIEDDILFGPSSQQAIEAAIGHAKSDAWDLMFTDVCVPDPMTMLQLLNLKKTNGGRSVLIDLRNIVFAGTTSLILNKRAKAKYLALIADDEALFSLPIDLLIRKYVLEGMLKASCIFPFPTSLSAFSESSDIQPQDTEIDNVLWNAFRKAIWLHADAQIATEIVDRIPLTCFDPDTLVISKIVAGRLTRAFAAQASAASAAP